MRVRQRMIAAMFSLFRKWRRSRVRKKEFPAAWVEILKRNVPLFSRLTDADREELKRDLLVFLDEKRFEGCAGLEITDEVRVTIGALACMLLLREKHDYYPDLVTILVYPSRYKATQRELLAHGVVREGESTRLGESWSGGNVVLSWDAALAGAKDMRDGQNVVLHEFAHQLDQKDGTPDGAPELARWAMYGPWAQVLGVEYQSLKSDKGKRQKTLIDKYGATNPAEFFAVVTEAFFEKPRQFKEKHPELYEQLQLFYGQDPATNKTRTL